MKLKLADFSYGQHTLTGSAPAAAYDLPTDHGMRWERVSWNLHLCLEPDQIEIKGELHADLILDCARCLEPLPWHPHCPDFYFRSKIKDNTEIDLTPFMREDILLTLPMAPSCQLTEDFRCPITGTPHAPDHRPSASLRPDLWNQLDDLTKI